MTMQRWPRTHERTNARDKAKRVAPQDSKPWLHRRSARHAPAPTATTMLGSERLSLVLPPDVDRAKPCGHHWCKCGEPKPPVMPFW